MKATNTRIRVGNAIGLNRNNPFPLPTREVVGGKPARTGDDVLAATKKRPKEALFVALRAHGYRLRTWSRRPTAKLARPTKKYFRNY